MWAKTKWGALKCGVEKAGVEISVVNDGAEYTFAVFYALMTRKPTQLYDAVLSKLHTLQPESSRRMWWPTIRRGSAGDDGDAPNVRRWIGHFGILVSLRPSANVINDKRIRTWLQRYDDCNVYSRLQFLKAVSRSVSAFADDLCEPEDNSFDDDEPDCNPPPAVAEVEETINTGWRWQLWSLPRGTKRKSNSVCTSHGHSRFCASCAGQANQSINQGLPAELLQG